jgi:hypothetical protein
VGVLTDYFRAPDAETVLRAKDVLHGPLRSEAGFDGVEAKAIDPGVVLGQLVAFIRRVPWESDLVPSTPVWPSPESQPTSDAQYKALPEDSPWKTGPWVEELGAPVRDTLAALDDTRVSDLAAQWARIKEFGGIAEAEDLRSLIRDLRDLAKRAREAGDQLYCWICL